MFTVIKIDKKDRREKFKNRIEFRSAYCEDPNRNKEGYLGYFKEDFKDLQLSCLKEWIDEAYELEQKKPLIEKDTPSLTTDSETEYSSDYTSDMESDKEIEFENTLLENSNVIETNNSTIDENKSIPTILDSGAMSHSTYSVDDLKNIKDVDNLYVKGIGKGYTKIKHIGEMCYTEGGNIKYPITLKNVLVLPFSKNNIISIPRLDENGYDTYFKNGKAIVNKGGKTIIEAVLKNRLYIVAETAPIKIERTYVSLIEHHEKRAHINFDACRRELKMPPVDKNTKNPKCEACDQAKMPDPTPPKERKKEASEIGYAIHIDMSPKHPQSTNGGYTRIIYFVDEKSKYIMLEPCRHKSDAFNIIKGKILEIENAIAPRKISKIRCDGASELVKKKELREFYKEKGIRVQRSAPYHQYQNGLVERMVRTIDEGSRAMMLRANSPNGDWLLTKNYFVYVRNHFYIPEGINMPPAEMWEGVNDPLDAHGAFGSKVMAKIIYNRKKNQIPREMRKTRRCVFLGVDEECKAFIVRPYDGKKSCRDIRYAKVVSFHNDYPYTHNEVPRPTPPIIETDFSSSESDDKNEDTTSTSNNENEEQSDQGEELEQGEYHDQGEIETDNDFEKKRDILDSDYSSEEDQVHNDYLDHKHIDSDESENTLIGSSGSEIDINESSSEESYKQRLRNKKRVDYTKGVNLKNRMRNKKGKVVVNKTKILQEICYNFEGEKNIHNFNFNLGEYNNYKIFNQNIFKSDEQELDEIYRKYGREKHPRTTKRCVRVRTKIFG